MTLTLERQRAKRLGLYGLLARWNEFEHEPWLKILLEVEEQERQKRSLEKRVGRAKIGAFKFMADFDWAWPSRVNRAQVEELFTFQFVEEAANVVLLGQNGVGKTMIAQNLAHQALLRGHSVKFTTASAMLNELAAQETASALNRCLKRYSSPQVLVIDEVGYLSYGTRHADLLFEVITRRYQQRSTIVTTNKPFSEWSEVFPSAACMVTLIDRLVHRAEIVPIEGESFRVREARERAAEKEKKRKTKKSES